MDITHSLDGGVLKEISIHGNGTERPHKGCKVFVHYTGTLPNGKVFDKTNDVPFQFTLGKGLKKKTMFYTVFNLFIFLDMTIKGFELAVSSMTCGEISNFKCHPNYGYGQDGFENVIPPNTWITFKIHLINCVWEDISRKKDGSITKQILEPGSGHDTPRSVSFVNINLLKEENGCENKEVNVEFRLGEGKIHGICPGIEQALTKFKMHEKSRLFIHGKHTFLNPSIENYVEVYVVKLNFFEKVCFKKLVNNIKKLIDFIFF